MSFFDLFKQPDVNRGVKEFQRTSGAVLLDVRTPEEYRSGHIPGSTLILLYAPIHIRLFEKVEEVHVHTSVFSFVIPL